MLVRAPGSKPTLEPSGVGLVVAPNPARGDALARYQVDQAGNGRLLLMGLDGAEALHWDLGVLAPGEGTQRLDLQGLAPGLYILALQQDQSGGLRTLSLFKLAITP
jgi:hypothetical protein